MEQAANRLAVYDADGNKVGELIDGLVSGHPIVVFQEGGIKIPLAVRENGFPIGGTQKLLFTTADCTGQAYIKTNSVFDIVSVIIAPDTLWVADRTQSFMSITVGSFLKPDGICEPTIPSSDTVLPALELADLGVFTPPFTIR